MEGKGSRALRSGGSSTERVSAAAARGAAGADGMLGVNGLRFSTLCLIFIWARGWERGRRECIAWKISVYTFGSGKIILIGRLVAAPESNLHTHTLSFYTMQLMKKNVNSPYGLYYA